MIAYYAVMKLGAVAVMLNPMSVKREILFKFRDSGARGVIALDIFYDQFIKPSREVGVDMIIFCGIVDFHSSLRPPRPTERPEGVLDMRSMVRQGGSSIQPADVGQDELAVIIYTGGTTGDPKGVMQSHRNHIYNSRAISAWGRFDENDRGLVVLPLFHGFGMAVMNSTIIRGGSLVLAPRFEIEDVFRQIDRHRPTVMIGYYNNPDATKDSIRDGWLHTGDIGTMDEDGYFRILDRKKEMIIVGGFNIYPKEVENILKSHPGVMEAAVIGVPDSYRGETVKAFIVPKEGVTLTEPEMSGFCKENMVRYMVPKLFEFRRSLPKSPIGKIVKKELKAEEIDKTR
jgi:acyl-CoA synthetase (AMP-forming)/AMP-acid ligase II